MRKVMKLIPLSQGLFAKVDDEDFANISQFKWHAQPSRNTVYAVRSLRVKGDIPNQTIRMHREILKLSPGQKVDHRDSDGLNNQRENLREATSTTNGQNRKKFAGRYPYKGVHLRHRKACVVFHAEIKVNTHKIHLGHFDNPVLAALAYDAAARQHFGEFARTNF